MNARVVGQLRVERGDEDAPIAREHRMAVDLGENLDVGPRVLDPRRADEDGAHGLVAVAQVEVGLERVHLAAERVPRGANVGEPEMLAVEHDHAGAGAEDRRLEGKQGLVEAVEAHQPRDRRRLASGQDQAVEAVRARRAGAPRPARRRGVAGRPRARGNCPERREPRSEAPCSRREL